MLPIKVQTKQKTIDQVRIVPRNGFYVVEVVYKKEQIGVLCIGKSAGWKQEANLGKRNNQHFVQLPHARFINMLTYKAQLVGIRVIITEESYTSKASLLDLDPLPVRDSENNDEKHTFSGKCVKRGLYCASDGCTLNADVNGAGNIIRKVAPDVFGFKGVEDGKGVLASLVVHPVRVVVPLTKPKNKHFLVKASKRARERSIPLENAMVFGTIDSYWRRNVR